MVVVLKFISICLFIAMAHNGISYTKNAQFLKFAVDGCKWKA